MKESHRSRSPRELVDIQALTSSRLKNNEQEIGQRGQETYMNEKNSCHISSVIRKYTGDGSKVRPLGINIESLSK